MGRSAKVGLFLLMGLVVALARLIEVEIGKPRITNDNIALAVIAAPPIPKRPPHPVLPHVVHHPHPQTATPPVAKAPVPVPTPTPATKPAPASETSGEWPHGPLYTVRKGETPAAIAKKVLGSSKLWTKIYELNKSRLSNPNVVKPGTRLVLPPKEPGSSSGPTPAMSKTSSVEKDEDD